MHTIFNLKVSLRENATLVELQRAVFGVMYDLAVENEKASLGPLVCTPQRSQSCASIDGRGYGVEYQVTLKRGFGE